MVKVNRINTSQIEGAYSNGGDKRPNGEIALYNDNNGGFDLVIHDGTNSTNLNKVLGKGKLYGHNADSADGNGYDTIKLIPDIPAYDSGSDQYVIVDPTGPNHVHLRAGGTIDNSNSELIVGGENSNIKVGAGADPEITIKSNNNTWTFATSGDLQFPSQLSVSPLSNFVPASGTVIQQPSGQILNILSVGSGGFMAAGWIEDASGPGGVASISFNEIPGDVRISTGSFAEVVNTWIYDSIGNLTIPGDIILSNDSKVATGTFDNGTSGNSGISLVCSVGYELNWQGGHLINTQDGGITAANIICDSAIELPGTGMDNMEINSSGLVFSDGTMQNTAYNPKLFGSFYDTTTQTNISSSGVNTVSYNSALISSGISVVSGDRITFSKNAHYNIQFSLQYEKTDSGDDTIDLWLSKTGVYEPWSNTSVSVLGNNGKAVASWNFIVQANSGDYYQLHWYSPDTNMKLLAQTGLINPTRPDIPSVILTAIEI